MVVSLSARNPIPRTTIQGDYQRVCKMTYEERREHAAELIADPASLVEKFTNSVAVFSSYNNPEGFYSNKNRAPKPPDPIKTHHIAWYLRRQEVLEVGNAPDLNAEYVDYEIAPTRTTDHAYFDDDTNDDRKPWSTGIIIDLLLANCDDRTPIIAELKIRDDKDPFTALVQMLAGIVHLVTRDQYQRLRDFMPAGRFPATDHPRLDGYVLLHRFLESPQDDLETLGQQAKELSRILMNQSEIATHVRRIACVDIELRADSKLHGICRWRYGE